MNKELIEIEEEITLLEKEGKKISIQNKMKLKKLQRARDKIKFPIEPSSVFVSTYTIQKSIKLINIDDIFMPNFKDRTGIDNKKIIELAQSIKENGLIQPIVVVDNDNGTYTKISGRRRILATKINGKNQIEAIIKKEEIGVKKLNLLILHENTQREDLSNYDKVRSVLNLIEQEFKLKQEDAKKICHRVNNFNKGNFIKKDKNLLLLSVTLNKLLEETKIFSSISHLVKHLPVLDMRLEILELLESNKITFGMALLFNQYSKKSFKENTSFSSIIQSIINQDLSLKDAKRYFNDMLYKKETTKEKHIIIDIKLQLNSLNKLVSNLEEKQLKKFNDELNYLLEKYK